MSMFNVSSLLVVVSVLVSIVGCTSPQDSSEDAGLPVVKDETGTFAVIKTNKGEIRIKLFKEQRIVKGYQINC